MQLPLALSLTLLCLVFVLAAVTQTCAFPSHKTPSETLAITGNGSTPNVTVSSIWKVPFYQIVNYTTKNTERYDPKVHDLHIQHLTYYTHVFFSWMEADSDLSVVATYSDVSGQRIAGTNTVYNISKLSAMYAPDEITLVLNFVRRCYEHAKPASAESRNTPGYVSTLRAYDSDDINKLLVGETVRRFRLTSPPGSYHLAWETGAKMDNFMTSHNYTVHLCGNSVGPSNPCDWKLMGLPAEMADDLCLYRLINK
ncbi:unnamed protein product [Calicophoron daubneyi]|uniref:Uncharacterized protein n=1 Tax=Calicophoron daubneyi TaxID=300641 RepID=A0AAV2U2E0_CALDB